MAFKRGSKANWTQTRTFMIDDDASLDVEIKIVKKAELERAIENENGDPGTIEQLVKSITGYQDENGKELGKDAFMADVEAGEIQPAIVYGLSQLCVDTNFRAIAKN